MPNPGPLPVLNRARSVLRQFFPARSAAELYLDAQARSGTFAFIHINKCGGTSVEKALGLPKIHDTAQQRRSRVGDDRWAQMFSFALVRHPFDKVCSHYRYRVKTNQTGLGDTPLPLNEFVRRAYGERDPRLYDKPLMFAPCLAWLTDTSGAMMVTHVARLEDIATEWPLICAQIGRDVPFPQANRTERGTTGSELSPENKVLIRDLFAADFDAFGY